MRKSWNVCGGEGKRLDERWLKRCTSFSGCRRSALESGLPLPQFWTWTLTSNTTTPGLTNRDRLRDRDAKLQDGVCIKHSKQTHSPDCSYDRRVTVPLLFRGEVLTSVKTLIESRRIVRMDRWRHRDHGAPCKPEVLAAAHHAAVTPTARPTKLCPLLTTAKISLCICSFGSAANQSAREFRWIATVELWLEALGW